MIKKSYSVGKLANLDKSMVFMDLTIGEWIIITKDR